MSAFLALRILLAGCSRARRCGLIGILVVLNEGTRSLPTKTSIFILASEILSCDFMAGIELPHSGMNEQPFPHQVRRGPAHACALSWLGRPTCEAPSIYMWLSRLSIRNNNGGYPVSYGLRMLGRAPPLVCYLSTYGTNNRDRRPSQHTIETNVTNPRPNRATFLPSLEPTTPVFPNSLDRYESSASDERMSEFVRFRGMCLFRFPEMCDQSLSGGRRYYTGVRYGSIGRSTARPDP